MRRILTLFTVVAVALALAAPAQAQFARAEVAGTVSDPDGLPLPGVTVTARNQNTGLTRTVVTQATGGYLFQGLVPGTYTLTYTLQGFRGVEHTDIQLHVGEQPRINTTLALSSVEETITVTAQTPMVESGSKEIGSSLTSREIEDLPSISRSFIMFAALIPGVVAREGRGTVSSDVIYVNGQDDNNNQFNIDGAANDDDQNGGNAGGQVRAAFEAMEEFQILTSQFDAEFGRSMGGVINAVTKSGTNEFHGVGFYYAQKAQWNEKPFFDERAGRGKPDFDFLGVGFTAGGPIIQNRTHFFVSFEHLKPNQPVTSNFDDLAGGAWASESFSEPEDNKVYNWVLKLDHQVTDNNKFAARLLWEYQPQDNTFCGDCNRFNRGHEEDYDWTFVTSMDSVLSDTMFNNFRWSFTREDLDFLHAELAAEDCRTFECIATKPPGLQYDDIRVGFIGQQSRRQNNSIDFDDTLSWYLPDKKGDHDIRTGVRFSIKEVDRSRGQDANGRFFFRTNQPFDINDATTYPEFFQIKIGASRGVPPEQNLPATYVVGPFFQDDWQPIPNLTLNLGLRWDWETITEGDYNNFGPRLGVSWDPIGDGKTTVRAGFGRFYSRYIFAEWEDPRQLGVFNTRGITLGFKDFDTDESDFVAAFATSGCTDLTCLRDFLRGEVEGNIDTLGFNSSPVVEGAGLGFRDAPFADTLSVGVEREVMDNLSIGVDVVRTEAKNQYYRVTFNDFSRSMGRPQLSIFQGVNRTDFGNISMDVNGDQFPEGKTTHTSVLVSLRKRMSRTAIGALSGRVSYTYSDSSGNVDNAAFARDPYFHGFSESGWNFDTGEPIGELPNVNLDHPLNSDRPVQWYREHNFVVSGSWIVPRSSWRDNGGLVFSGIFRAVTGNRDFFELDSRIDNNRRGIAPAGSYTANNPNDISFSNYEFDGKIWGMHNPNTTTLDFSARYRVPFGSRGWYATISLDAFNITNVVNFSNTGSDRISRSSFLIPSRARALRQIQAGVKFTY